MLKKILNNIKKHNLKPKNYMSNDVQYRANFLAGLSMQAIELYEHKKDVERFTKLAMSETNSCEEVAKINDLLSQGLIPESLHPVDVDQLSSNKKLWDDLDLEN